MSKRRISLAVVGLLVVSGLAGLLWVVWERFQNRLTVENRSGQPIALLEIAIGGETVAFRNMADGATVTAAFTIATDDHFAVEGRLADGTRLGGKFGYVTNGMCGERAAFGVQPAGKIAFEQTGRISPY
jgi:hypothetical protein